MRKTSFIFAGIMASIIGNAYAVGENTVASKAYVDTKQVKLHAANAEPANNGTTVVTYTDTEGTTGERGIFDYSTGMTTNENTGSTEIVTGHEGDLLTAGETVPIMIRFGQFAEAVSDAIGPLMNGTGGTVVVRDNNGKPYASANIYDDTVANYDSSTQSHDIPTMGAVMSAITAGLPTGTAGNVVTYDANGVAGGSVAVYNGSNPYNANALITAGAVQGQISGINTNINNQITNVNNNTTNVANALTSQNLESIKIQELTCANENDGCTLWQIGSAGKAHRLTSCDTANDCPSCGTGLSAVCGTDEFCHCVYGYCASVNDCPSCGTGTVKACTNNVCACNACKADGVLASAASECCSGRWGHERGDHICCGTPGSDIECSGK